jgi:pyruvate formate lyase activating enzyme
MEINNIAYEVLDIHTNGKEAFTLFYRENRSHIFRGPEGVEFPILSAGGKIFQGVGLALAYLMADERLDGSVTRGELSHGWISGLNVSAKTAGDGFEFLCLLRFLKDHGLMIQIEADGRNSVLLKSILKERLVQRLFFYLRGTADLYEALTGTALSPEELSYSLSLLDGSVDYQIILPIVFMARRNGGSAWLSPEEAAGAAEFAEKATGRKKHPFFIKALAPPESSHVPPLSEAELFKYRTLCRRYMVLCDILKS